MTVPQREFSVGFGNRTSDFIAVLEKIDSKVPEDNCRILSVFFDTHMSYNHTSLEKIAGRRGLSLAGLKPGQLVVFINSPQTAMKVFTSGNTFAYQRMKTGYINLGVIRLLPRHFTAGVINYDRALESLLRKELQIFAKQ